jgi:hypothetical protein
MPASQICARCVACFSMERPFRHVLIGAISHASSRAEMSGERHAGTVTFVLLLPHLTGVLP